MKKKLLALLALSGCIFTTHAQDDHLNAILNLKEHIAGDATVSEMRYAKFEGTVNVPSADPQWRPLLTHRFEEHEPGLSITPDQIKAAKAKVRADYEARLLAENQNNRVMANTYVPIVGVNYSSNKNDQSTPQDNNIAISNHGVIVSVSNSTLEIDDSSGANHYYQQITALTSGISNVCDPVVIYDVRADRFIFYAQECSGASSSSKLLIFFSKTNNPATGGWNYYTLSGNPKNNGNWSDYPKIGLNDNEVFISSNLFSDAGSYSESVLWQIGKAVGYAGSGGTLSYKVWTGIAGSPFTLLPLTDGQGNSQSPGMWVVCTNPGGASTYDLYQITNTVANNPVMNHYSVPCTAYAPLGNDLPQKGSTVLLSSGNDCRTMSGFLLNGIAHFVFQCDYGDAVHNAVCYNRLDVNAKTNTAKIFGSTTSNYSFPAVASFSTSKSDPSVMIVCGHTDGTIFPEFCAVNCDPGMNFSVATSVKKSTSYVNFISSGGSERWGDYSGMCRKHNSLNPSVWCQGSTGNASHSWDSWNAEIHMNLATGIPEPVNPVSSFKAYPNPVIDIFRVEFSIEQDAKTEIALYDMQGRLVKALYSGYCMAGENSFSFNKSNLSKGTYFLSIKTNSNTVRNEKIVIAD
jgi:hypothetical protein